MIFERVKKWLGIETKVDTDYKMLVGDGAQIIDVRTPSEYASGHIPNSVNIPLNHLNKRISKVGKDKQIILCCASGMRSSSARSMLLSLGYRYVYNGGSWSRLMEKIK